VRNRELLRRIDRHLDRADERWASIDEEIRLTREEIRLSREQRDRHAAMADRHAAAFGELRVFTHDMMSRMERLTRAQVKASEEHTAAIRGLREDSVAHRRALLRILDRLGPGPGDSQSAT
jgi:hypothetical protein